MRDDDFPRFSDAELVKRRKAFARVIADHQVDAALVYGSDRSGSAIPWLTEWPVTREAALVTGPQKMDALFVQFYNHVPAARRLAIDATVSWGGPDTITSVVAELRARRVRRLGVVGPLKWSAYRRLAEEFEVIGLDQDYQRLRLVKSPEEIDWLRRGAALSDAAIEAVRAGAAPGITEAELGAMCEAAYLATGATNHIHYFGVTSMADPDRCVPAQWPSSRVVRAGDAITCEISASWWGHAGQVLRTIGVEADPTPLYRDLHAVADAAFDAICAVLRHGTRPAEVIEAAGVIEESGFTVYDDLVHGYGGGYLPPILGSASRMNEPLPDLSFEAGMTVVVQPNVITADERAGVQTGGLVLVTETGIEQLQLVPRGFWRSG